MFKRIMSVMLAIVMLMSVAMIATSAAQVEIADNSAEAVAEVAADGAADTGADAGADTAAGNVFNFDANSAGWNNFKKVFCHVWVYGGDSFYAWQAKKEACTDTDADGIWTYDLDAKGITLEAGTLYAVIFSNENGMQTYNLLAGTECIGDTAYCNDTMYENPEDSSKTAQAAFWKGQDETVYGPEKCITSIGNVVGTCVPKTTSSQAMFVDFLVNKLENARTYSGKNDQQLLDDTAAALNLKQDNVKDAIYTSGATVDWTAENSSLPTGFDQNGVIDGSGNVDKGEDTQGAKPGQGSIKEESEAGKNATSNGGSSSNSGSSSSNSGSSGSGSNTKTGPETTALFIMIGVMLAAAGVIVLARKERA